MYNKCMGLYGNLANGFPLKTVVCDFSRFSEEDFNSELAQADWGSILARTQGNIDIAFFKNL